MQVEDNQLVFQDKLKKVAYGAISEIDDDNKFEGIINEKYLEQNS